MCIRRYRAGLKKRTRKAFGIRKKEKDTDSTGSPDRDGEEIARPRRSTATPTPIAEPVSKKALEDPTALFGPPLETAFEAQKTEVVIDESEVWGVPRPSGPNQEAPLPRPFPTGMVYPKDKPVSPPPVPLIPPMPSETKAASPPAEPTRNIPPPLNLNGKRSSDLHPGKDHAVESTASPKEFGQGPRATPPPPPPPTYRTVVSSPGPCPGAGTGSGSSSPARPATPLASCSTTPPPPPPRPPSRPKLPPGKPGAGDVPRPFSPPAHSSSPPTVAPLARAESTSSISSTNSLSAATTPTVGKDLSVSVSEEDAFVDKLPTFDRHCDTPAGSKAY
ncbi:SH3-containing GRB2-like protein 3-interacting protein 1 [Acipenser ruthenus]|uniref:SH3-containing GRB2-like protein 3-interacting protein 1 n=1 Tax=Acipenser ruthenus TaxID=7906 RepID=A0A662YLY3_ACIRT|nr:SH3-containing GRB2-like protein 3-interacting protein 1 [Acipenser ruthenus]